MFRTDATLKKVPARRAGGAARGLGAGGSSTAAGGLAGASSSGGGGVGATARDAVLEQAREEREEREEQQGTADEGPHFAQTHDGSLRLFGVHVLIVCGLRKGVKVIFIYRPAPRYIQYCTGTRPGPVQYCTVRSLNKFSTVLYLCIFYIFIFKQWQPR